MASIWDKVVTLPEVDTSSPIDLTLRTRVGLLGGWASIVVNFLLFILKLVLGLISHSLALIADAFHTLSDVATSLILIISIKIAGKPGDREHPFGHGRVEYISTIIIATLLAVTGFEIGKSGVERILRPMPLSPGWLVIFLTFLTIGLKELLAQFAFYLAERIDSPTLQADAWHHRTDAISTILVVLALILSRFGYYYLDGILALGVSFYIIYTAYSISRKSIDDLLGTPGDEQLIARVEDLALQVPGVLGVHDVVVHSYGMFKVVTLHIEVDESLSLLEAHQISEAVNQKIRETLKLYNTVHVDPVMKRTDEYVKVEQLVRQFCQSQPLCESFHDLRIIGENNFRNLYVDLVARDALAESQENQMKRSFKEMVHRELPDIDNVIVKIEPHFSISRRSRHSESL